jgi:hypothetical protein
MTSLKIDFMRRFMVFVRGFVWFFLMDGFGMEEGQKSSTQGVQLQKNKRSSKVVQKLFEVV